MGALSKGMRIPEFTLEDDRGRRITDRDLSAGTVVLFVYPKDETPGCTKEACAFRDGLDAFTERGAKVYGLSPDDRESHARFRDKYGLSYPLLADPTHTVCEALGVWGEQRFGAHTYVGAARTTFVLQDGLVETVFEDVDVTGHVERVLAELSVCSRKA